MMTEVTDNDIEDGIPQATTTETPSGSSVDDDNAAEPSNGGRPLSRAPTVFNLSDLGESSPSHLSSYVPTSIGTTVIQLTVRKIRLKGMELNADESTIVVNYMQDVCVMDTKGKVISTESTP
ncbi:hypothetical protein FOZ62_006738, partial [Perkinsus olseni]